MESDLVLDLLRRILSIFTIGLACTAAVVLAAIAALIRSDESD